MKTFTVTRYEPDEIARGERSFRVECDSCWSTCTLDPYPVMAKAVADFVANHNCPGS